MTLIKSRQKPTYNWNAGDLIGTKEAAALLGWRSPRNLQGDRLDDLAKDFEAAGVSLTKDLFIGGQRKFLRSEFEAFITNSVEFARKQAA